MSYIFYNPNPQRRLVGDCVIRGISVATDKSWDDVFVELMVQAYQMKNMPSANEVWGAYLNRLGFRRVVIPNTCPDCYMVTDFCRDYHKGTYILGTGTHVIAVKDGNYYDIWDSGNEIPIYYWKEEI